MNVAECSDAGSEFCPCHLAELGECVTCSFLNGKTLCECSWGGTCVYMEYQWNDRKAKQGRTTIKVPVTYRKKFRDDLLLIELDVGHKLAQDLLRPGSMIFLRGESEEPFFDTPLAVVSSDPKKGNIVVVMTIQGPKTKLISKSYDSMFVRGPYWNGIIGYRFIQETRNSRCFLVLGGVSQASGALVANQMIKNENEVNILFNSADSTFIESYIDEPVKLFRAPVLSDNWMKIVKDMVNDSEVSCIYSGGNNKQHELLAKVIRESGRSINLVTSNNSKMQCGEGVCGCCTYNNDGRPLRGCKSQKINSYRTI